MPARDPFSEEQMLAILKSEAFKIGDKLRNQTIFSMECSTGARINEIMKLRRKDVMEYDGSLKKIIYYTRTKNKTTIKVDFVNPIGRHFLQKWLKRQEQIGGMRSTTHLFRSPVYPERALTIRQIQKIYLKGIRECGFHGNYGTHSCRKTWAMQTYRYYQEQRRKGADIDPLIKLFETGRWRSFESMRHYLSFEKTGVEESQENLYSDLQAKLLEDF